jgi:uncharacterized protein YecT (DUF1311 family)
MTPGGSTAPAARGTPSRTELGRVLAPLFSGRDLGGNIACVSKGRTCRNCNRQLRPNRSNSLEARRLRMSVGILVVTCMFVEGALSQESHPAIRQIAPERFQPNLRDDSGPRGAAATITPPSKEHPFGSCDKASRGWLICLRSTADLSMLMVSEAENRILASLSERPNLSSSLRQVLSKALSDADSKWLALREQECNQLALLEVQPGTQLYEAQLICQIAHNAERIDQLSAHYGYSASQAAASPKAP